MRSIQYRRIRIVEFDGPGVAEELSPHLSKIFSMESGIVNAPFPNANMRGDQFDARDIVKFLGEEGLRDDEIVLGITEKDAYVPELNFVFGLADPTSGSAMISLNRLEHGDKAIFLERCLKEAVHELGHLLSLDHCRDSLCVMHFSNSLLDTDMKSYMFCSHCKTLLRNANLRAL